MSKSTSNRNRHYHWEQFKMGIPILLFMAAILIFVPACRSNSNLPSEEAILQAGTVVMETWIANVVDITLQAYATQDAIAISPSATQTFTQSPPPTLTFIPTRTPQPPPGETATPSDTPGPTYTPSVTIPVSYEAVCVPSDTDRDIGQVIGIVDGDTIQVRINGIDFKVNYLGIEAPAIGSRFGDEAVMANGNLVLWQWVTLVKGPIQKDIPGYLLRYVFVGDRFANYELVRKGYALAASNPSDLACGDTFKKAQNDARQYRLNYWSSGPTNTPWPTDPHLTPSRTPTLTMTKTPNKPPDPRCTCYGPPLACSDFKTQSAAQACYKYCVDLGFGNVYGLDGEDTDHLACENLP